MLLPRHVHALKRGMNMQRGFTVGPPPWTPAPTPCTSIFDRGESVPKPTFLLSVEIAIAAGSLVKVRLSPIFSGVNHEDFVFF